jgi:hypothetical protein
MKRIFSAALVLLMLTSSIGGVAVTANAADIAIQAETSVDEPAPGEPFRINVNLSNVGDESVEVTDVYIRKHSGGGIEEYSRAEDLGTISKGGDRSVPISVTLDEAGWQRLNVHAVVQDPSGSYTDVSYPVYVDVEPSDETTVSFTNLDPVAGDESPVEVTLSNGDSGAISNVKLSVGGEVVVEDADRVYPSLAATSQTTDTYNVTFPDAGERTLNATVQYRTSDGVTRTDTFETATDVEPADIDTELTATVTEANDSSVIQATLSEYGNVALTDVQLQAIVDGEVVKRTSVPDVPGSSTETFTLDSSDIPAGELTLVATYTAANDDHTSETTFDFTPSQQSNIELTGIDAVRTGSTVTVSGEAANLGSLDASSVLVTVADTDAIAPASPNGEYFVGGVESSEFATFELTADADQSIDSIPVEIRYSTDGEQFVQTARVDISTTESVSQEDGAAASSGSGGSNNSGIPFIGLGIVLVLGVLGGGGLYWWRHQS